jgi:hypothetical protein
VCVWLSVNVDILEKKEIRRRRRRENIEVKPSIDHYLAQEDDARA